MDIHSSYISMISQIMIHIQSDLALLPEGAEKESLRLVLEELEAAVREVSSRKL